MTRARKWLLGAGVGAGVLALLAALLLSLVPSDEELAGRASAELEAALGVPVHVGALHWRLRPTPTVVIEEVATGQSQAIEIKRLTAHLNTSALWQRRLKVDLAVVQGAVLPQLSLGGLGRRAHSRWMRCRWRASSLARSPGFRATASAWCTKGRRISMPPGGRARPGSAARKPVRPPT